MTPEPTQCQRSGCERVADLIVTVGRGAEARVRRYCAPCAAECRAVFGRDVIFERVPEQPVHACTYTLSARRTSYLVTCAVCGELPVSPETFMEAAEACEAHENPSPAQEGAVNGRSDSIDQLTEIPCADE